MVNDIKTFPIQMTKEFHEKVKKAAEKKGVTLTEFIFDAIEEKIKEGAD